MLKFNNRHTRKSCETCLKLTLKIPERGQKRRSGALWLSFNICVSHFFLLFLLLTLSKQMLARLELFKRKKSYCEITLWPAVWGYVPWNKCSEKFRKCHRKTTVSESLFNKTADPQQIFYRRLREQLARTFNGIWSSKKI